MLRLLLSIFLTFGVASSQEVTSPAMVQEKLTQWVLIKKTIGEERAKWAMEKEMLVDLAAIRKREIRQKKGSDLKCEEKKRKVWRNDSEKRFSAIEDSLISQLAFLPVPLKNKGCEDGGELQGRFRDVLAILNECIAFNSQIPDHYFWDQGCRIPLRRNLRGINHHGIWPRCRDPRPDFTRLAFPKNSGNPIQDGNGQSSLHQRAKKGGARTR